VWLGQIQSSLRSASSWQFLLPIVKQLFQLKYESPVPSFIKFFFPVFDSSLKEKQFAPVEIAGTILIAVGFLVLVLADRVSLERIKDKWEFLVKKATSCWLTARKVAPVRGVVTITDPPTSSAEASPPSSPAPSIQRSESKDSGICENDKQRKLSRSVQKF
jgi:hypothetical protein